MPPPEWLLAGSVALGGFYAASLMPLTPYGIRGVQAASALVALAILVASRLR